MIKSRREFPSTQNLLNYYCVDFIELYIIKSKETKFLKNRG